MLTSHPYAQARRWYNLSRLKSDLFLRQGFTMQDINKFVFTQACKLTVGVWFSPDQNDIVWYPLDIILTESEVGYMVNGDPLVIRPLERQADSVMKLFSMVIGRCQATKGFRVSGRYGFVIAFNLSDSYGTLFSVTNKNYVKWGEDNEYT